MGAGPWTQDTALLLAALGCTDRESWGGGGGPPPLLTASPESTRSTGGLQGCLHVRLALLKQET